MKEKLYALFESQLAAHETFGGAAAVLRGGETVFAESFGGERFSDNALYRLASVTKIFTATAVLQLADAGKIDIAAPVSAYLPDYQRLALGAIASDGRICSAGMPPREITLSDLLTHTAGLGADALGNREYETMDPAKKTSLASVTAEYAQSFHLAFAPGTRAAYSGFAGYDVLARIVETVSGESFNDYLQAHICAPLGMTDTTFQPTDAQYARFVPMHKRIGGEDREIDYRGALYRGMPRSYEAGGASLISSMADMLRFANMLLGGGAGILRPETVERMLAPALPEGLDGLSRGENIGLGCFVISGEHRLPKGTVYSHGAYGTHLVLHPSRGVAGVFLKNSLSGMSLTSSCTKTFEEIVFSH